MQSDTSGNVDVETWLKHYLFEKQEGEEEPYLTAVHRLDRPVGGLMVFARTKEAAAELSRQIQNHEFEKYYQAIVCGALPQEFGTFEDMLLRDGKTNTTKVVPPGTKGAKHAELDYEMIDQIRDPGRNPFLGSRHPAHRTPPSDPGAVCLPGASACTAIPSTIQSSKRQRKNTCSLGYIPPDWPSIIRSPARSWYLRRNRRAKPLS